MVSKSRSETLHVWAKTLARLHDCATVVVSILLTWALLHIGGRRGCSAVKWVLHTGFDPDIEGVGARESGFV
jgi:hypothetical protein